MTVINSLLQRCIPHRALALRTAACALICTLAAGIAGAQVSDASIVTARDARERGDWAALFATQDKSRGHVLEAYPTFWLLAAELEKAEPARIEAFLKQYDGQPVAEQLRREWLRQLGRTREWGPFRQQFPMLASADADIACYALEERLQRDDTTAFDEARTVWHAEKEAPSTCGRLFDQLAIASKLTVDDVFTRFRRMLALNVPRDARRTLAYLPSNLAAAERDIELALSEPSKYVKRSDFKTRAQQSLVIAALARIARDDAEQAATDLKRIQSRLADDDVALSWAIIAHSGAIQHRPDANDWFKRAAGAPFTESQAAWRVRAALRVRDWPQVSSAIAAMPAENRREFAWRYWFARAIHEQGKTEEAKPFFAELSREHGFYALLAAEEMNALPVPDWTPAAIEKSDLERVGAVPGVQRATALYRLGLREEGFREWVEAVRGMTDRDLLAAAEHARVNGIADRAVNTANRTASFHDFTQRFPMPYLESARGSSEKVGLDLSWVYAIIRQESRFMADVRSRAGAVGLMQLMPATARWTADKLGIKDFRMAQLTEPDVNLALGTRYLRSVYDDLGHRVLATAAYNAGPGRAKRWRDGGSLEGAIYIETIPFNETRDYVKQVMMNKYYYEHRLSGKRLSLKEMIGTISPRSSTTGSTTAATDTAAAGS